MRFSCFYSGEKVCVYSGGGVTVFPALGNLVAFYLHDMAHIYDYIPKSPCLPPASFVAPITL